MPEKKSLKIIFAFLVFLLFNMNPASIFAQVHVYETQWGSTGSGPGSFENPCGLAVDKQGFIYVADSHNDRIQKFNPRGEYVGQWGSYGEEGRGKFHRVSDVKIDKEGFVYVIDHYNDLIQKFTPDGNFKSQFSICDADNTKGASYLALDSNGYLYVNMLGPNIDYVDKFRPSETCLQWGGSGTGNGKFRSPRGVAVDSRGFIYVVDQGNLRVQKFSPEGQYVSQWGSWGMFMTPMGIAIDSHDYVYVSDISLSCVKKFTSDGVFKVNIGDCSSSGAGYSEDDFSTPKYIAFDSEDNLYISDWSHNKIVKYKSTPIKERPRSIPGGKIISR